MLAYFRSSMPWPAVARRTLREVGDDNCLGLAAQLAFYFLLALFPALLFLVALIGFVPVEDALAELLTTIATVAPRELVELLRRQLTSVAEGRRGSLLTLGIVAAIWSSSAAMVAIIDALNRAYDVAEWRPWWKRRLVAIVLTLSLALFSSVAFALVVIGPEVAARAAAWLGLGPWAGVVWGLIRWPAMIASVVIGVDLVYHFAPNRPARWVWLTPGSVLATGLWLAGSFGFKAYLVNFADYTATYGAIGGAIVAMLWFYLSGLAILVGAELNAVIEHASRDEPAGAA